jgi:hypothetical protein
MSWYIAKIVFQVITGNGRHTPQFDGQWRLIRAGSLQEAYARAGIIGLQEEEEFVNAAREPVKWKYIGVPVLNSLGELRDGMELASAIEESEDAAQYIRSIRQKAEDIETRLQDASVQAL